MRRRLLGSGPFSNIKLTVTSINTSWCRVRSKHPTQRDQEERREEDMGPERVCFGRGQSEPSAP